MKKVRLIFTRNTPRVFRTIKNTRLLHSARYLGALLPGWFSVSTWFEMEKKAICGRSSLTPFLF